LKIVMMGTGPFAVPTFQALLQDGHDIPLLVTRPIVMGKGKKAPPASPMRIVGQENGIQIFDPASINTELAIEKLASYQADLLVVCDYGQILSNDALATTRLGGINLHGSLLPKYRGAAPVQWCVYSGDPQTGVSVIHMTPRLDGGPLIAVAQTPIEDHETAETLEIRLSEMGVASVRQAIIALENWDGQSAMGQLQDSSLVTKAPRLNKRMSEIDWQRSAVEIRNQIRAFQPWPGSFTTIQKQNANPLRLIVDWVEIVSDPQFKQRIQATDGPETSSAAIQIVDANDRVPGMIVVAGKDFAWVQTGNGILSLERLQPAGKRIMAIGEILRGYPLQSGTQFSSPNLAT